MLKFGDLINRLRHNRGFGVQSPSAFYFVTQVLKEKLPYYAYKEIDRTAESYGTQGKEYYRRLFRVANHFGPQNIIIAEQRKSAAHTALATARRNATITCTDGNSNVPLQSAMQCNKGATLVYIGECDNYARCGDTAIQNAATDTIIVIEGIHRDNGRKAWWEKAVSNPRTVVTYDLYSAGILLFDKEKQKQNYTLLM